MAVSTAWRHFFSSLGAAIAGLGDICDKNRIIKLQLFDRKQFKTILVPANSNPSQGIASGGHVKTDRTRTGAFNVIWP